MAAESPSAEPRQLTRKGQATRDRIVAAAAQLIFEGGVTGTSVDDVQKAAGVSASQLYHYFDGKEMLVRAVIAFQTTAILNVQQPLLGQLDTIEGLRAWRDLIVGIQKHAHCEGGCPIGTIASEISETCPACRTDLSASLTQWETMIRDGLQAMHDRGNLRRSADPDRLAAATIAAVQGGLMLTQVHRNTRQLEAALDTVIDHIASLQTRRRLVP
jgi:TetR/AcrR family transcriptional repressor of nem operon